jgi:hypothetical protein
LKLPHCVGEIRPDTKRPPSPKLLRRTSPTRAPEPCAHRCTKPACFAPACCIPDENFDGGRAFLLESSFDRGTMRSRAIAPHRKTGHQKRSQFRFEVPARIASPGGRCRKGRCDCSPASRERFEGTLMNGPQSLAASLKRALPGKACVAQPLLRHILPARTLQAYAEPS